MLPYDDEPTLPASPPTPTTALAPPSPPPVVALLPPRPTTRRQSAARLTTDVPELASTSSSSSSLGCQQVTAGCSPSSSSSGSSKGKPSSGGGGRPRRGKENIPPPSEGSSSSSSASAAGGFHNATNNSGPSYDEADIPMRASDDDEADELNVSRAAAPPAASRPATLKRGRTPSMADLGPANTATSRRRIVRSESSSSSSFKLARSSPITSDNAQPTPSFSNASAAAAANLTCPSGPAQPDLPTPNKPTTRSAAAACSSFSSSSDHGLPSPIKTPEPPRRAQAIRMRTMPEFTTLNNGGRGQQQQQQQQLATPPKTPAKGRSTSAGPSPTKLGSVGKRELKPSLYARARALLRCSSSTLTTSSAAAAAAASKLSTTAEDDDESGPSAFNGGALIGRSDEYRQILDFLTPALQLAGSSPPARSGRRGQPMTTTTSSSSEVPKTMYVSGPPGTGKTALLARLAERQREDGTTVGVVNCFTASAGPGGRAMWERIGEELFGEGEWRKGAGREGVVERLQQAKDRKFILILDELDSLVAVPIASTSASSSSSSSAASGSPSTLSPSLLLLQTLFLLPTTTANLALLAISNTLDFASRYLGTLPCPPQTLAFAAYDASQMSAIILDRLAGLTEVAAPGGEPEVVVVIEDKAVELAARKVMAENGDLRLCLDVVRLAVELVEVEWKKASLAATAVGSGTATVVPIKKAGMTHVLKALQKAKAVACASRTAGGAAAAAAGGGLAAGGVRTVDGVPRTPSKKTANAGTVQKIQALNIQSRLVLVALVIHLRRASLGLAPLSSSSSSTTSSAASSAERTTSGALLSTYSYLLSSADSPVHALSPSDFHTVLALLADAALVSLDQASPAKRRTPASAIVQLACLEDEVVKGLVGGAKQTAGTGGVEEEEARRILEREEGRMDRLRTRLGKERKMEKACALEDRL